MEKLQVVSVVFPMIAIICSISVGGWVITTWLRIKNGYPLDGAWGQALHPSSDKEAMERIKLLSSENAQLRAEVGSMKDRLETVERIVTDGGYDTAVKIEALRGPRLTAERKQ